jgi:RNA polymerase sigma-70 factor, ECF subfamily
MAQDQSLIEAVLRGDRAAFETVVLQHQSAVYAYLRARLLSAADAEDLTQEVFLRFYLARMRFDTGQLIRPWLLGIARNLLREHTRQAKREKRLIWTELGREPEQLLHTRHPEENDALDYLPECLDSLGQSARQAIQFYYTESLRLVEIGERLKRSEGAVKLLIFRARQALKLCIDHKTRNGDGSL